MQKRIADIADIKTGFHLRASARDFAGDDLYFLRASDLIRLDSVFLDNIDQESTGLSGIAIPYEFEVQRGDVLLSSRAIRNGFFKAVVFDATFKKPVYAGLSLFVISLKSPEILPEYLALYLNTREFQKQLRNIAIGVTVPALQASKVKELKIPVPSMKQQQALVDYARAAEEEKKLLKQKIGLQDQILKTLPTLIK